MRKLSLDLKRSGKMSVQRKPESKLNENKSNQPRQGRLQKLLVKRQRAAAVSLARKIIGKQRKATVMKAVTILQNSLKTKPLKLKSKTAGKLSRKPKQN